MWQYIVASPVVRVPSQEHLKVLFPPELVLDNLATFASFVSQFTPIRIVFCQKKKMMMSMMMTMINDAKSSNCGKCTYNIIYVVRNPTAKFAKEIVSLRFPLL